MARLREFDTEEVLESVINAFWERGYEATSLADLMAVTGLQKGSIYKAFGDKRSLFLQALQVYLDRQYSLMRETLRQPDPKQAIGKMFHYLADTTSPTNKGCFALNSLVEMSPHDEAVAKLLAWQYERIGQLLEKAIAKGQRSGVFRQDLSAEALRQLLIVAANGTLASSRAAFLKPDLPAVADSILMVMQE
jgi:TetR/AcrR family transcriptional regulator, transcriptional repressor for nem operon